MAKKRDVSRFAAGQMARSDAGHDKGKLYVILKVEGENVLLVDGLHKILEKPKKKKHKHLKKTEFFADLSAYSPLYDAHILKELKSVIKKGGCCLG